MVRVGSHGCECKFVRESRWNISRIELRSVTMGIVVTRVNACRWLLILPTYSIVDTQDHGYCCRLESIGKVGP
jgi:hypothetical protein